MITERALISEYERKWAVIVTSLLVFLICSFVGRYTSVDVAVNDLTMHSLSFNAEIVVGCSDVALAPRGVQYSRAKVTDAGTPVCSSELLAGNTSGLDKILHALHLAHGV